MTKKLKILKLDPISPPKLESEPSNFWNSCIEKYDYLPESPCKAGTPDSNYQTSCEWWINSKEHNYCFWKYVKNNSREDGSLPPLKRKELAELLGISLHCLGEEIRSACDNLTLLLHEHGILEEEISDSGNSETLLNSLLFSNFEDDFTI